MGAAGECLSVSIRVFVGIAQEPLPVPYERPARFSFNPCVGRNSSGASIWPTMTTTFVWFQSVCLSE